MIEDASMITTTKGGQVPEYMQSDAVGEALAFCFKQSPPWSKFAMAKFLVRVVSRGPRRIQDYVEGAIGHWREQGKIPEQQYQRWLLDSASMVRLTDEMLDRAWQRFVGVDKSNHQPGKADVSDVQQNTLQQLVASCSGGVSKEVVQAMKLVFPERNWTVSICREILNAPNGKGEYVETMDIAPDDLLKLVGEIQRMRSGTIGQIHAALESNLLFVGPNTSLSLLRRLRIRAIYDLMREKKPGGQSRLRDRCEAVLKTGSFAPETPVHGRSRSERRAVRQGWTVHGAIRSFPEPIR